MPYDVKYRDKNGQVRTMTVHSVQDTGDGYVRIDRDYHTVIDPHTSATFIDKKDILEVRGRDASVMDTDFHPPVVDQVRGAIDAFNKWRKS